eukprot:CAMPEP_0180309432 /NCGR_PEP_ID=MMETSP0988-20121125/29109_1 /TAXON_ID=697907 /ORGANISM="non described non described, Strain CCMP2293" /LENGTH=153 /DNA_ID=CAMNT_0022293237 /DNA_START=343 /DNA_END=801 /DNA_ORIENTATION=-
MPRPGPRNSKLRIGIVLALAVSMAGTAALWSVHHDGPLGLHGPGRVKQQISRNLQGLKSLPTDAPTSAAPISQQPPNESTGPISQQPPNKSTGPAAGPSNPEAGPSGKDEAGLNPSDPKKTNKTHPAAAAAPHPTAAGVSPEAGLEAKVGVVS